MKSERLYYGVVILLVVFSYSFFAASASNEAKNPGVVQGVSTTRAPSQSLVSGKKLVFSDEFDSKQISNDNWSTCYDWKKPAETGCTNKGNLEQQWYRPENIKLQDGQLVISAQKQQVDVAVQGQAKTYDYTSGMINSGRGSLDGSVKWAGTYGYYEARMKFSKGQGVWPAFWLLLIDKQWPPEIDIMEFIGGKPDEILQTVHWQEGGKAQKSDAITASTIEYSGVWHTYAVDWQPDHIDWYIDGVKTRSYTGPNVPDKPMEIIINLAIGGLLPGNADKTTPFPAQLHVDYVRVYQSPEQITPTSY